MDIFSQLYFIIEKKENRYLFAPTGGDHTIGSSGSALRSIWWSRSYQALDKSPGQESKKVSAK